MAKFAMIWMPAAALVCAVTALSAWAAGRDPAVGMLATGCFSGSNDCLAPVTQVIYDLSPSPPPAPPATLPDYSASQFRAMVIGKTKQDVVAALGPPNEVNDGIRAGSQMYDYSDAMGHFPRFQVHDDTTGLQQKFVTVVFGPDGQAERVDF